MKFDICSIGSIQKRSFCFLAFRSLERGGTTLTYSEQGSKTPQRLRYFCQPTGGQWVKAGGLERKKRMPSGGTIGCPL